VDGLRFGGCTSTGSGGAGRFDGREEKQNLFDNLADPLSRVSQEIPVRQLGHFDQADAVYGAWVERR